MRRWFVGEPEPIEPPRDWEVVAALESAGAMLGCQPALAKGAAVAFVEGQWCFCIVAAITAASRTTQIRDLAMDAARRALQGRHWQAKIEAFNDDPHTTISDAKELLARAKSNVGRYAA